LNKDRGRLLEIVEDGGLSPDEMDDFERIKENLAKISLASSTLQLWYENARSKLEQ
jgi:hypothetical protein